MPGAVVRPLVEPVPVYPWAMVHRADVTTRGWRRWLGRGGARRDAKGWHEIPDDAWLPSADATWSVPAVTAPSGGNVIRSGCYRDHFV